MLFNTIERKQLTLKFIKYTSIVSELFYYFILYTILAVYQKVSFYISIQKPQE